MQNRVALLLGGLSVALLSACGGSTNTTVQSSSSPGDNGAGGPLSTVNPGQSGADVCAYIGTDGAKAILGTDVGTPKKDSNVPYPNCLFPATGTSFGTVSITVFHGQQAADGLMAGAAQLDATIAVSGVGDRAYADSKGQVLVARKGDTGCTVTVVGEKLPGTPESRDQQMGAFCTNAFG
jgi:hypothetical protein